MTTYNTTNINTTMTTTNTDVYDITTGTTFIGYSDPEPSTTLTLDGEVYDLKSMFYLIKALLKKNDLPTNLLNMEFDELKVIVDREIGLDDLLKDD